MPAGVEELEHGVPQPERFGRGEVVDVAQHLQRGVRQRSGQRLARAGEVLVADDDQHGARGRGEVGRLQRRRVGGA